MAELTAISFRVQNYRNVDDSGWVPLDRVTALVGRNEAGKTAILKALHKFNPSDRDPFMAQFEFPRYRYTNEFKGNPSKPWPVISIKFRIGDELRAALASLLEDGQQPPESVTVTRHYPVDSAKEPYTTSYEFSPPVSDPDAPARRLVDALKKMEKDARLITPPGDGDGQDEQVRTTREELVSWAMGILEEAKKVQKEVASLRVAPGRALVERVLAEAIARVKPASKPAIAPLLDEVTEIREMITRPAAAARLWEEAEQHIPVFIYFENYGILRDEIYLPQFIQDLQRTPNDPVTRTRHALFRHVRLEPKEIHELGLELAPTKPENDRDAAIRLDEAKKHERSVQLSSASQDITDRFTKWYKQRRHNFRYQADGNYFRIWVSDDRRRDEIELQARSKGLQWFFSFYLVFLVESDFGHKDAILLLDEPGLHLHPTAQQELIAFFEELSERNQLLYTTHSPFLVDPNHLHRVRPVVEDEKGFSRVTNDFWPPDRDTIFPLQAALGYSMMQTLFEGRRQVLVEGLSEYFYVRGLSLQLRSAGREALAEDISITPSEGTKLMSQLASLYLGQGIRPLVLLDSDDAGRGRYKSMLENLYQHNKDHLLLLSEVLGQPECEIEDLIGEEIVVRALSDMISRKVELLPSDRLAAATLRRRIEAWAQRNSVALPIGWRGRVAKQVVTDWSTMSPNDMPTELLDRAENLIRLINQRAGGTV